MATEQDNFQMRIALLRIFMRNNGYDAVLLSRADNFAMATGGKRNYVSVGSDLGAASLLITKEGKAFFVGNGIEEPRVMDEELAGLGCDVKSFLWFDGNSAQRVRQEFSGNLVSDDGSLGENVHDKLAYLRALLTPLELDKYRRLGALAADAMMAVLDSIQPGDAEADIAARLAYEGAKRRCLVPVRLVAADERIAKYRHPLPTEKCARGYVMVAAGFQQEGLVVSMTRFKKVGETTANLEDAMARIAAVDALMQEAARPGRTLGDIFVDCQRAYAKMGFPANEWHNHHQGGTTGYAGRTCKATPGSAFPILDPQWALAVKEIIGEDIPFGHAFAWNPSARGVKSEDTFILTPDGTTEIVTRTPALPQIDLKTIVGRDTDVSKSGMAF